MRLRCSKCKKFKSVKNFYKSKHASRGYRHYCKLCCGVACNKYRKQNLVRFAKRTLAHRTKLRLQNPEKFREQERVKLKKHRAEQPQKAAARNAVSNALAKGLLHRSPCVICNNHNLYVEAHHTDYTKPLDVMWLCKSHHAAWHRVLETETI